MGLLVGLDRVGCLFGLNVRMFWCAFRAGCLGLLWWARGSGCVSSQVAGILLLRALWGWLVCGLVSASPLFVCVCVLGRCGGLSGV